MPVLQNRYAALGYSLPANPSRPRVYVWRRLRALGAENLRPGLAVLPDNPDSRRLLSELSQQVREMGGEASLYTLLFSDPTEERRLMALFAQRTTDTLEKLKAQLAAAPSPAARRRVALELKKAIDHYQRLSAPEDASLRREVEIALRSVLDAMRGLPGMFTEELRELIGP